MSDMRLLISSAAREALRLGEGDDARIVDLFRETAPAEVRLPGSRTPRDNQQIRAFLQRVVDGNLVIHGEETSGFTSALALGETANPLTFGCTGFLVSTDILLTAGHCIDANITGGVWLEDLDGERHPLTPTSHRRHERFGIPAAFANDIGMIQLSEAVSDVEIYRIADTITIDQAAALRIVGFGNDENGTSEVKRTAAVSIRLNPSDGTIGFRDLEFVIGDPLIATDGDASEGDSGGPVLVDVGGVHRLAGLISRRVAAVGDGSICLRLDRYVDWIDTTIQALGGQPRPT